MHVYVRISDRFGWEALKCNMTMSKREYRDSFFILVSILLPQYNGLSVPYFDLAISISTINIYLVLISAQQAGAVTLQKYTKNFGFIFTLTQYLHIYTIMYRPYLFETVVF